MDPVLHPTSSPTTASTGSTVSITSLTPTPLHSASVSVSGPNGSSGPAASQVNASQGISVPTAIPPSNIASAASIHSAISDVSTTVPVVSSGTAIPSSRVAGISHAAQLLAFNDLPQEEINRHKNIFAVQVLIPKIFCKMLEWGSHKNQSDTFYKYLTVDKNFTPDQLRNQYHIFRDHDLNALKQSDPLSMDAPLLCKVILASCDEFSEANKRVFKKNKISKVAKKKRTGSREKAKDLLVTLVKNRNEICHDIKTSAVSSTIFDDTIKMLEELIEVGGKLYKKNLAEIKEEIKQLKEKIDSVMKTKSERDRIALQYWFHTKGYSETKSYWNKYCNEADAFYPLDVLPKPSSSHERPMSYQKMFDDIRVPDDRPVIIIQGEAGSGKSTLLKQIAMQFFQLTKNEWSALEEFHLLHFLQCNNQTYDDLGDFIKKYFHETCKIMSPEDALRCFPYLGNLILIDGYDEINLHSVRVAKQFIDAKKKNPACQLVFTARPHVVTDLEDLLKREGVHHNIYQLMEISQEKQQLNFLERLDDDPRVRETFSNLPQDIKNFFVLPINLIQFHNSFRDSPEEVKQWADINDVVQDIMFQNERLIASKLKHRGIKNLDRFIEEVLMKLCDFAFEGLMTRMFTLDKDNCEKLQKHCYDKIEKWDLMQVVDGNEILSVVYVNKLIPSRDAVPTYQYSHKSMQELMSARSLLKNLTLEENRTVSEILQARLHNIEDHLQESTEISAGLLNVFKFVLMIFSHPKKRSLLQRWLPQLEEVLTEAKADWQDMMMSCNKPENPEDDSVAKIAARKKLEASKEWLASTARDVTAIARMIPHAQPDKIDVELAASEGTPAELAIIVKLFAGELKLNIQQSYETYAPLDHTLNELTSRCSVTALTGCLASSSASTGRLAPSLNQRGTRLDISLEHPSLHTLLDLQGKEPILNVKIRHHDLTTPRPLPKGFSPPLLIVEDAPALGAKGLRASILHHAPEGALYFSLWLEKTLLDDAALNCLLQELYDAGVRTEYHSGKTCWTVARMSSDSVCLHCHKSHDESRCVWLQLAEEQTSREYALTSKAKPLVKLHQPAEGSSIVREEVKLLASSQPDATLQGSEQLEPHSQLMQEEEEEISSGHRNSYAIQIILTSVLQAILEWGCPKQPDETFWEYLEKRYRTKFTKQMKRFNAREQEMLQQEDCNKFHFALLYNSIPDLCTNVAPHGIDDRSHDQQSLEGLLIRAKQIKNTGSYHPKEVAGVQRSEFEELIDQILSKAGDRFKVKSTIVETKVKDHREQIYQLWSDRCDDGTESENEKVEDASWKKTFNDEMQLCGRLVVQEVASDVMKIVIEWGCSKPPDMTFIDYMEDLHDKRTMRRFSGSYNRLMQTSDLSGFDVTLLFNVIPFVCKDLNFRRSNTCEKSKSSNVENLLHDIKTSRDEIMFIYPGKPVHLNQLRLLEDQFISLIIATGERYKIDDDEVKKKVRTARCKLFKVVDGFIKESLR